MPGVVNDPLALEVTRMIRNHFIAQQHDDAFGMGAHKNHSAGGARIDAVAIVIGHDQAGGAGPDCLLNEPVERALHSIERTAASVASRERSHSRAYRPRSTRGLQASHADATRSVAS